MLDGQVENENECSEQTLGAGWILKKASRSQIYIRLGQVDIFGSSHPVEVNLELAKICRLNENRSPRVGRACSRLLTCTLGDEGIMASIAFFFSIGDPPPPCTH